MDHSGEDLEALLAGEEPVSLPQRGQVLEGTVLLVDTSGLIVDLGLKRDGVIPRSDLDNLEAGDFVPACGDEISVMVIDPVDIHGNLVVSIAQARES